MEAEHGLGAAEQRGPHARRTLVDRSRLFALLADPPPLTVVRGPRGAGKSALLATWAAAHPGRPTVAVATPDRSAGPRTYWADVAERVAAILAVEGSGAPVTLTLDDVDRLGDPTTDARVLDLLARHERLHVVVTTRTTGVFDEEQLLDVDHRTITPAELAFTLDETREALLARGIDLPRGLLETVDEVTGGLPALLHAVAPVARRIGAGRADERSTARQTLERTVDRYVEREFLADPEVLDLRDVVLALAAARVVTPDVVRELAGDCGSERDPRMERLERAGVLMRSAWPHDHEWRYPAPVRAALVRSSLPAGPGPLPASSRLARWFAARGDIPAAVEHGVEARDWDLVVSLVKENWVGLLSGHVRLIRDTLRAIPASAAVREPVIRAGHDLFLRFGSHTAPISLADAPTIDPPATADAQTVIDALFVGSVTSMILRVGGQFAQAAELAQRMSYLGDRAVAMDPARVSGFLPVLRLQWGIAHQLHGDLARASAEFRRAYHDNRPSGADFVSRSAAGSLALNYALAGELRHAEDWLEKERRHEDESTWPARLVRVSGRAAAVLVAIERMETDAAAKILAELGDLPDDEEMWAFAAYAHCQLALVTHQADVGLDRLRRAHAVYARWCTPAAIAAPLLAAAEADLHLALGHGNETWMTLAGAPGRGPWPTIAHARMELCSGQPAETIADCLRSSVADCPYPLIRTESALLQAAAHLDLGHESQARAMLRRAVALFEQTGIVRPFASVPAGRMAALSQLDVELPSAWAASAPSPGVAVYPDHVELVDLSERESAVLAALAATASVAEIASRLFVSQNTVKTQLRSLYRKLGVHRRADALLTAARLGLIGSDTES